MKVGLIGCGKQSSKHIRGLKSLPDVSITLMDQVPELAKEVAQRTGTEWTDNYK